MFSFGWWRDKDNREGAKTIVDVLKVGVPAAGVLAVAVWGYFQATSDEKPAAAAPAISGVTVTTGEDSSVNIGGTQTVTRE